MTQCWSEGEIRAYLDSELPPRDMDRVAAHVKECAACGGLRAELEIRATQVSGLLDSLPEPNLATPMLRRAPRRSGAGRRWVGAAAGLAASLAIGPALLPKRVEKAVVVPPAQAPAKVTVTPPPPPPVAPAIIRRVPRKGAAPVKPKPKIDYYIALDDEPIETGLVVRVGLNGGQVPADVIVGPDGRARAIRLVSDFSGEPK